MTTAYEFACGYTKLGVATAPSSAPTITIVDSVNNALVSGAATTALTNLSGAYRYSYSGADGLTLYAVFHTTDTSIDQQDLFAVAMIGPSVRSVQVDTTEILTRLPDATAGATGGLAIVGSAMDLTDALKHKAGASGYSRTTDSLEAIGENAQTAATGGTGGSLAITDYPVTDSLTGLPVEGATVELYPTSGYVPASIINSQITDVLGHVTFSNLAAGTYYLKIIRAGYTTAYDSEVAA